MFNIPGISKEELEKARKAASEDMKKDNDTSKSKDKGSRKSTRKVSKNS